MTPKQHRRLIREAKLELAPADAKAATALAQVCAIAIKGACLRYNVSLLYDPRYTMPIPVCFRCRGYMEALWENDPESDEAALRVDRAVALTWERGHAIGAVVVTGEITDATPRN